MQDSRNHLKPVATLLAAAALSLAATSASAAGGSPGMDSLDFLSLGLGDLHTTFASLPEGDITSFGSSMDVSNKLAAYGGAICALSANGDCKADLEIDFTGAVHDLQFNKVLAGAGDKTVLSIYDGATLLGTQTLKGNGTVDLSSYGDITRLVFDDQSKAKGDGMFYGAFCFTSSVPEPGTTGLLLAGLGLLGLKARRRSEG